MTIWPLVVYFAAVILIVATMLSLSYVLGQRHKEPATGSPFESGIVSEGSVHVRFSVKFYLVAMFFVVFRPRSCLHLSLGSRGPRTWLGRLLRSAHLHRSAHRQRSHIFGGRERSTGTRRDPAQKERPEMPSPLVQRNSLEELVRPGEIPLRTPSGAAWSSPGSRICWAGGERTRSGRLTSASHVATWRWPPA